MAPRNVTTSYGVPLMIMSVSLIAWPLFNDAHGLTLRKHQKWTNINAVNDDLFTYLILLKAFKKIMYQKNPIHYRKWLIPLNWAHVFKNWAKRFCSVANERRDYKVYFVPIFVYVFMLQSGDVSKKACTTVRIVLAKIVIYALEFQFEVVACKK